MSTEVGTIEVRAGGVQALGGDGVRPRGRRLIMSAVALTQAGHLRLRSHQRRRRRGTRASSRPWRAACWRRPSVPTATRRDAGKLEAMEGRVLAATIAAEGIGIPLWDAGKLEAMEGRMLAG